MPPAGAWRRGVIGRFIVVCVAFGSGKMYHGMDFCFLGLHAGISRLAV